MIVFASAPYLVGRSLLPNYNNIFKTCHYFQNILNGCVWHKELIVVESEKTAETEVAELSEAESGSPMT